MISEKQLEANRRNARRSTGPTTAEGKERSSRNNLRHGLTGQITVLPSEDREAHDLFCNRLIQCLNPENPMEEQSANSIAEDSWRLNRVTAIETNIFALGRDRERREFQCALKDAETFLDQARNFQLLSLYEQRINRNLQRNLKQLRELRAERREQEHTRLDAEKVERERQMEDAKLLAQHSLMNGLPADLKTSDPTVNGFEFSAAEINLAIDRDSRLQEAGELASSAENHPPQLLTRLARAA
jgi:hypothetical protein